ncbi:MAG: transglycosylase SLT domain-containing protein, partial [Bdellovibrio sp.]
MRKLLLASLILLSGCATKSRQPSSVASLPSDAWKLDQALAQGTVPTLDYLKVHITAKPYSGLNGRDPSAQLPKEIRAEKGTPVSKEKNQQSVFLRKFRGWTPEHRVQHGDELVANFSCENAVETQSMGYILEIDFPEQKAKELSQSLHDKVLTCPEFSKQESVFRLAVFSIQAGDCAKALDYLNKYPASPERGSQDRSTYLKSFCSPSVAGEIRNPLGGYGILLGDVEKSDDTKNPWVLGVSSGDENWDRLLATFAQLTEKNKSETVQFLASKINYEKLRSLPISFQTSMLILMSFNGADLSVFQTLHKYLADHPETMTPSVSALLFPIRYWKEIVDNTSKTDPVLVKALIRQESAFNKAARSRAKASGL